MEEIVRLEIELAYNDSAVLTITPQWYPLWLLNLTVLLSPDWETLKTHTDFSRACFTARIKKSMYCHQWWLLNKSGECPSIPASDEPSFPHLLSWQQFLSNFPHTQIFGDNLLNHIYQPLRSGRIWRRSIFKWSLTCLNSVFLLISYDDNHYIPGTSKIIF